MTEILASREILLLVSALPKRQPLERLLQREITTEFPASFCAAFELDAVL